MAELRGVKTQSVEVPGATIKGGGGRGKYSEANDDFPHAALRGAKTQPKTQANAMVSPLDDEHTSFQRLVMLAKNVQSVQAEDRMKEFHAEVTELTNWDIIFINETWRGTKEEQFQSSDGHLYLLAGGTPGRNGVGIVVHRRWVASVDTFRPVHPRLCFSDVQINGVKLRLASVYMPHARYEDSEVDQIYEMITAMKRQANLQGKIVVVMGDWNAVIGRGGGVEGDESKYVGNHGLGHRNHRGNMLAHWAVTERVVIVNTLFEKPYDKKWSHRGKHGQRQLDYGVVDFRARRFVKDAEASNELSVGKDHRTIRVVFEFPCERQRRRQYSTKRSGRGWRPQNENGYKGDVSNSIANAAQSQDFFRKPLQEKCTQIEKELAGIAERWRGTEERNKAWHNHISEKAKGLTQERRRAREGGGRTMKAISKDLQRELRACERIQKRHAIEQILRDFKGLDRTRNIRNNGQRTRLVSMHDEHGVEQHGRQEIVDVFASFYEELCRMICDEHSQREAPTSSSMRPCSNIKPISKAEVQKQAAAMKNDKAVDGSGIAAEMLKFGGEALFEIISGLFNEVLLEGTLPPEDWRHTRIKVLFKKGDVKAPGNYRPISLLQILYKLFSRVLRERLKPYLLPQRSCDQAGFRPGFSCEDHLLTLVLVHEKLAEFNLDLWIAAVDFEKAFDSVSHESIFEALRSQDTPEEYVRVLEHVYGSQTGQVIADKTSRSFKMERGTRQGDPISPTLFNAVLEGIFHKLKLQWRRKRFGIQGDLEYL